MTMPEVAMIKVSFRSIVPLIPAGSSLADDLAFYTQQLGFSVTWQSDTMAGIARDSIAFNLIENVNREWAENASFSIGVTGLDALYDELRGISARVGPLEMKSWGRREFHIVVPSGVCYQFYEAETV